ncbi:unnamed protein product [Allacma fusca]|uniref:Dolichol-phosphate mannosyltransferase subunit 3 n=1 Tax=Allacma fusca TaxID=39272 RepID=A0A8J2LHS7_9HEXA|nr:unnamed protein product [Allacma fusca]
MTKLTEFLAVFTAFIAGWLLIVKLCGNNVVSTYVLLPLPLHVIIIFGIYSVATVLYRTFNFKDCPAAAKELQEQIEEARKDLRMKGLKF